MLNANAAGGSAGWASLSNNTALYGPIVVMSREVFEVVPVSERELESAPSVWRKTLVGGRWCLIDGERIAHPIEIRRYASED